MNKPALKALQEIPGVGKSIAKDLHDLGFRSAADLKRKNPEKMYSDLCRKRGQHIDRCMLYVFRCAVYYASTKKHNPNKLLWWNWKDNIEKTNRRVR
ncbi:MAG: helix-hairpin-helix domain-containing protein [candidate division Zixibacteria bacterium]|nr:helix-hairpin-helix domain-containing protein [candidate division Zixibacteria bacterium]